jgi:dynein heavy chain
LTGTLQNYARGGPVSIDELTFDLEVLPDIQADHKVPPQDGCYVYGLYLEGARWDTETKALSEPFKRQLYSPMPVLFLKPTERSKHTKKDHQNLTYNCPVYRTSKRSGALQSNGMSDNFVIDLNLRSYHPERYWVKRGVALICQLDY